MAITRYSYLLVLICGMLLGYVSYRAFALFPLLYSVFIIAHCKLKPDYYQVKWHKPYLIFVASFFAIALISLFWAEYFELSFDRLKKISLIVIGGILPLSFVPKTTDTHRFMHGLTVAWLIAVFIFIIDHMVPGTLVYGLFHTHSNILPQLNRMAVVLLLGALFIWNKSPDVKLRWLSLATTIIMLFMTQSQSVQLTFVLLCILYCVWPILKQKAIYIFGCGVTIFTVISPWLVQIMFTMRPSEFGVFGKQAAGMMRLEIWDAVSKKIMESPWVGYGLENIRRTPLDMDHLYVPFATVLHPHNYALQIWVETGALGVVMFLSVFWYGLRQLKRFSLGDQKLALSLMVTIWGINLSAYGLWQSWWVGMTILTMIIFYHVKQQIPTKDLHYVDGHD